MKHFLSQPFTLIDNTKQKLILIGFCLVFGIIFINIFLPFNINLWEKDSGIQQFFRLSSFSFIAAIVIACSQFLVRKLLKINSFLLGGFLLWFFGEVIIISLILHLIYGNLTFPFWPEYLQSFRYTFFGTLIPYFSSILIIYMLQQKELNASVVSSKGTGLIGIPDENGVVKLSLLLSNILYIESADNYIAVYYLDVDQIKSILIRNTLKNIENIFTNSSLKRCHRSYIVNINMIKMVQKKSSKLYLHIKNTTTVIPVSRNYTTAFESIIPSVPK
ncbi:LytR/AlgR family response regulator transcription factor [Flavivirga spongiicola]|uniref:LytTR family transcriptional regulator n=1 Tax=Flavivirga spongiicola TaxID=421621 RepID=A0ABU7XYP6_9FLAO|nr:LytTR family DNA-binding domain-containing protein [Flavivirga sp. MEBiC05379]MDO5980525.1 LytTR family DNA-binding domain-containing protein [Flavivirga sp. MEBiC05379]